MPINEAATLAWIDSLERLTGSRECDDLVQWEGGRQTPGLAMIEYLAKAVGVKAEFLAFGVRP